MISRTEQQMRTVYTNLVFTQTLRSHAYNHYALKIMTYYIFLSSLYNCLLRFISLTILFGEVRKFLGEVLKNFRRGAKSSQERPSRTSPQNPALIFHQDCISLSCLFHMRVRTEIVKSF